MIMVASATGRLTSVLPPSALVLLILVLAALSGSACDPVHSVTYDNRTDTAVTILYNGHFEASLKPMEKRTFDVIKFSQATFEARDSAGTLLYRETLTWAELNERAWKIIVTGPALPGGSPAPTQSAPASPSP